MTAEEPPLPWIDRFLAGEDVETPDFSGYDVIIGRDGKPMRATPEDNPILRIAREKIDAYRRAHSGVRLLEQSDDGLVEVGRAEPIEGGIVTATTRRANEILRATVVVDLDDPTRPVLTRYDGERYVLMLPRTLTGPDVWAEALQPAATSDD